MSTSNPAEAGRPTPPPRTLHFFIGTKAQYIKTAPVMAEAEARGLPVRLIDSGQHGEFSGRIRAELGLREPDISLGATDVNSIPQAVVWSLGLAGRLTSGRNLRRDVFGGRPGICLVHGDTPSTLLAALMARRARLPVAHLEAGLRSWSLRHPFPEEIIRILTMRMATYLFVPDDQAARNLERMGLSRGIFKLGANTTHEPLLDLLDVEDGEILEPSGPAVATCHRVENLRHPSRLSQLLETIRGQADSTDFVFVMHGPTEAAIRSRSLESLLDHPRIEVRSLEDHGDFVRLLAAAPFVMTDGGSIQEETAVLGVPTLVWRDRSERPDGLGANAVLSHFDPVVIGDFLADPGRRRRPVAIPGVRASSLVVDTLERELRTLA